VEDPFKVIHRHTFGNYYDDQPYELSREYASTEMLLANYPTQRFDSYIFGSSRSFPYHCADWEKYLQGARCFHYPAATETIYGITTKLLYLERLGMPVKHALIIVDHTALKVIEDRPDHLHVSHPAVSQNGWLRFQGRFLEAFLTSRFWLRYADYRLSGKTKPSMSDVFGIKKGAIRIDPINNDYDFVAEEATLATDPAQFYRQRASQFPLRSSAGPSTRPPVIESGQRELLVKMREVLERRGTDYRIVVTPFYDQLALAPEDHKALEEIFGPGRVHDFMGRNRFTESVTDWYDASHYRPYHRRRDPRAGLPGRGRGALRAPQGQDGGGHAGGAAAVDQLLSPVAHALAEIAIRRQPANGLRHRGPLGCAGGGRQRRPEQRGNGHQSREVALLVRGHGERDGGQAGGGELVERLAAGRDGELGLRHERHRIVDAAVQADLAGAGGGERVEAGDRPEERAQQHVDRRARQGAAHRLDGGLGEAQRIRPAERHEDA
jgi:hypothetical protein